ncbi:hypothetical protein HZA56_01990 [Candidatus Poribacteria bacterium]|nr:hypothetical protein [Candidatus Poribacteria bacterium]
MKTLRAIPTIFLGLALLFMAPASALAQRSVSVPDLSATAGANVVIPINIDDATGVAGADIALTFDSAVLTPRPPNAQLTPLTTGFSMAVNPNGGRVAVSIARATPITSGGGVFVEVLASVDDPPGACTSPLALESVTLYDETANVIPSITANGTFTVIPEIAITSGPSGAPNPVAAGGDVSLSATIDETCCQGLSYLWSATGGTFNDPTLQNPIWHAPTNATCATASYSIGVTVSCSEGQYATGSYQQDVLPGITDTVSINSGPSGAPDPVASGGDVSLSLAAEDTCGHGLSYLWNATGGTFSDPTLQNPVWHAPTNATCAAASYSIGVTVTCSEGQYATGSYQQDVLPGIADTVSITSAPSGAPNPVASGGDVNLSLTAEDTCGHALSYLWSATGGSFTNPTIRNPVWHAITNASCATALYTISVTVSCYEGLSASDSCQQAVFGSIADTVTITTDPSGAPNPAVSGGDVNVGVTVEDTCGHALSYLWSATGGTFSDPTAQNPVWHAPVNPTCATTSSYTISVTVTCSEGQYASDSYQQDVSPGVVDAVTITPAPSGAPNPVESAGDVNLSVTANDACGHALSYLWSAAGGSFDNSTAQTPAWTAPANLTSAVQHYDITVTVTCAEGESDTAAYSQGVEPEIRELHVDAANTCPGTGTVGDPFCSIQLGIDDAINGDTIIVRDGTYTGVDNRDLDFGGKAITLRSANGPANTIIDCQGNGRGFYFHSGEDSDSLVDGFTITGGSVAGYGGAIFCAAASPTIANCIISSNSAEAGGGILTEAGAPSITNCVVTGNSATYGGGIYSSVSPAPSISKCAISENSSYSGGGIMVYSGSPDIANCAIIGNTATYGAGLYYSFAPSSTTLTSCTVTANTASGGGGISCFASMLNIENCILWGNTASWGSSYGPEMTVGATGYDSSVSISYSDVKGGTSYIYVDPGCTLDWDAASNVNIDPLFVQPGYWNGTTWTEGDYHLNPASPCVDAGSISGVPADDIDGDPRPVGALPDIGSDEYMDDYQDAPLLLVPDAISITRGGVLGYDVTVINETLSPITFRYWTTVTRPDGNSHPPTGALLGPYEVALNGAESRSAHLTHRIPGTAPLGMYAYNAYIYGENPIIANEYHFNFSVEATP